MNLIALDPVENCLRFELFLLYFKIEKINFSHEHKQTISEFEIRFTSNEYRVQ